MRLILATAAASAAVLLSGCGQSEAAFRDSYRSSAVESCAAGARASAAGAPAGFDFERLCGCAIDAYMEGKTVAELTREQNQTTPPPEVMSAFQQCAAEQVQGIQGATG